MSDQEEVLKQVFDQIPIGATAATFAGAISAMHANLGKVQEQLTGDDARDIDSARVYLEAAFWKLETILHRAAGDGGDDDTCVCGAEMNSDECRLRAHLRGPQLAGGSNV